MFFAKLVFLSEYYKSNRKFVYTKSKCKKEHTKHKGYTIQKNGREKEEKVRKNLNSLQTKKGRIEQ